MELLNKHLYVKHVPLLHVLVSDVCMYICIFAVMNVRIFSDICVQFGCEYMYSYFIHTSVCMNVSMNTCKCVVNMLQNITRGRRTFNQRTSTIMSVQ